MFGPLTWEEIQKMPKGDVIERAYALGKAKGFREVSLNYIKNAMDWKVGQRGDIESVETLLHYPHFNETTFIYCVTTD